MDRVGDIALFLRVLDLGSISAAARSLDLSVAVASQRLKRLEADLNVRLFHRTTRHLTPTPEGLLLAEQGRVLVEDLEALSESLRRTGGGIAGTLRMRSIHVPDAVCRKLTLNKGGRPARKKRRAWRSQPM